MKLKTVCANQVEVTGKGSIVVLYSYSTPVAVFIPGVGGLCTTKKWSQTTSRHIASAIARWGCARQDVSQDVIEHYAQGYQSRCY